MVNYFPYAYPLPDRGRPLSVSAEKLPLLKGSFRLLVDRGTITSTE